MILYYRCKQQWYIIHNDMTWLCTKLLSKCFHDDSFSVPIIADIYFWSILCKRVIVCVYMRERQLLYIHDIVDTFIIIVIVARIQGASYLLY